MHKGRDDHEARDDQFYDDGAGDDDDDDDDAFVCLDARTALEPRGHNAKNNETITSLEDACYDRGIQQFSSEKNLSHEAP